MRFTTFVTGSLPIATLILAGSLMGKTPAPVIPAEASEIVSQGALIETNVSEVLKEIQSRAGKLTDETDALHSYTRGPALGWQMHATRLDAAKEHINAIGERLRYLETVKSTSALWQQQAMERIIPLAVDVAQSTKATFKEFNANTIRLHLTPYRDQVKALSLQADRLKKAIDPIVELNETQKRLNVIQERLAEAES